MTIKKKMIRNRKKIMSTLYALEMMLWVDLVPCSCFFGHLHVYMSMHTKITAQGFLLQEVHWRTS